MSRRRLAGLSALAVLVLLFGGRWVAVRYTEHAWYASLGQASRFWLLLGRSLLWQVAIAAVFTGWYAAHTFAVYRSIGSVHLPRRVGNIEIAEQVPPALLRAISFGLAVVLGLVSAWSFGDLGGAVALYRSTVPWGLEEPILGRDVSFYLGELPLYELLALACMVAVLVATALTVGLYFLTGNLALAGRRVRLTPHARTHLTILLCALALVLAVAFHLDGYQLVGGGGRLDGALAPVDRAVRLPASNALAVIALMVAAASALGLRWLKAGVLAGVWITLVVAALLGRLVVPALADVWRAADTQVLTRSLAQYADGWSRTGLGLAEVTSRLLDASVTLRPESALALQRALAGLSPWSGEAPLLEAALEAGVAPDSGLPRGWSVTWTAARDAAGRERLLAIGVSQLDAISLARRIPRPRWTETHRGAVAWGGEPVAVDAGLRGGPLRYFSNVAPVESAEVRTGLSLHGPVRIVPRPADLGVIAPNEVQVGEAPPGVRLERFGRRLLLAWALQSPPLMDDHTSQADRVLYWRDLPGRLARLYPFAAFDAARAVIAGGRLVWVADGYLISARFPLARHVRWYGEDINFLSPSFLVTVDATSAQTRLYLRGPHAAFARGVAAADHAGALPLDSLPSGLRTQLAYPAGLFAAQVAMLARLGEGGSRWALDAHDTAGSVEPDAASIRPAIALLDLDGTGARLWWISALADISGRGLGAIVAGAAPGGAPRLLVLRLDGSTFPTLTAAASRLAGTPDAVTGVAATGAETTVRRGPVLVLPAAGTLAYVQTVFATDDRTARPLSVAAVTTMVGQRVAAGRDAAAITRALVGGGSQTPGSPLADAALADARAAFVALDSARRAGDWERFGRAWEALRRALRADGTRP